MRERERSLKVKREKTERGDVPGVSGRTGPPSTTLEEQRRKKIKDGPGNRAKRETEREMTEGEEEEERLK